MIINFILRNDLSIKRNNSGVWIKGSNGNHDGDTDYYDVLQEILELEYLGWPYKKVVLFRCKWCDPTSKRGTNITCSTIQLRLITRGSITSMILL